MLPFNSIMTSRPRGIKAIIAVFAFVLMCSFFSSVQAQEPEEVWSDSSQSVEVVPQQEQSPLPEMYPILDDGQEAVSIEMEDKSVVRIRMLNKITAATRTYDLDVGKAVSFDGLRIQPRACRKAPPIAQPESAAFLEIWEIPAGQDKPQWIFSGWMFASSPGLSAMDHPVYDVWVLDCLDKKGQGSTADMIDAAPDTQESETPESSSESE